MAEQFVVGDRVALVQRIGRTDHLFPGTVRSLESPYRSNGEDRVDIVVELDSGEICAGISSLFRAWRD